MTKLYIAKTDSILDDSGRLMNREWEKAREVLPSYRIERIMRFAKDGDKARGILAGLLLQYGYRDYTGHVTAELPEVSYGVHEKPFFVGKENVQFNLSHSGNYVVCAFSEYPIGVDVQEIKPLKEHFIKRVYSEEEQAYVRSQPASVQNDAYMRLYAFKEALVKYTGEGMSRHFAELYVLPFLQQGTANAEGKCLYGQEITELTGYAFAIVGEDAVLAECALQKNFLE
ncbi:MAG: 4'-phosphopantetheinyl transferase superfamily protein [Lachnospiraceae bacterium]|nr:4'-phosphopantetheinyl transferase superfamily protein [Lachnospiraceae bacterium]